LPTFLHQETLRLVIFGGKGGVGKTTSAAATAMYLAQSDPDKRIAIASSDPAHSLSDSFDCPVRSSLTPVKGMDNLWAIEMDPASLLKRFRDEYKAAIGTLNDMSFSSDQADVRDFLSLKLPGMEDMMILLEIANLLKVGTFRPYKYDLVILDTAPTGHTLRLLSLTEKVLEWIELFQMSYDRHQRYAGGLAGLGMFKMRRNPARPRPGNVRGFLDALSENLRKIHDILGNPEKCEFVPMTIPEEMGIAETGRLFLDLRKRDIVVRNIIVNRVQTVNQCVFCSNRRKEQEKYLEEIHKKFASYNLINVPIFPHEVRAKEALLRYAKALMGEQGRKGEREKGCSPAPLFTSDPMPEIRGTDLQFLIFSGKGGVGKTTVSAATALYMAEKNPDKKILVISLDPAHSLSDSFALPMKLSQSEM
ncbi:MAG: TRC40/GET3/ArsA family transport-energizing ATPase, partial [Candidatus Zixiibacteriota bacterium]